MRLLRLAQGTHRCVRRAGKLRRSTDKQRRIVEFSLFLAAAITVVCRLINRARTHYRWDQRPTTRRLP